MILALILVLGVMNFAVHSAVLDSGHPLLGPFRQQSGTGRVRVTLALEFLVLVCALALADAGWTGIGWGYGIYSALNALSAWLILTRRL